MKDNDRKELRIVLGVAGVIQRADGKILLLHRDPDYHNFPGKWSVVTGHVEENENPEQTVIREIREELHVRAVITSSGPPVHIKLSDMTLVIHPFLCSTDSYDFELSEENDKYVWIFPEQIYEYDTVPQLDEDLRSVGLLKDNDNNRME